MRVIGLLLFVLIEFCFGLEPGIPLRLLGWNDLGADSRRSAPDTGAFASQQLSLWITARNLDYPESLSVWNRRITSSARLPLGRGALGLTLAQEISQSRILTSFQNDSIFFRSRTSFRNKAEAAEISYTGSLWREIGLSARLMPVFWNITVLDRTLLDHGNLGWGIGLSKELRWGTTVEADYTREYSNRDFSMEVLGFTSQSSWLGDLTVGNAFRIAMRNYLRTGTLELKVGQDLPLRLSADAGFLHRRINTVELFLLSEIMDLDALENRANLGLNFAAANWWKIKGAGEYRMLDGRLYLKYRRENGSYSSMIPNLSFLGNSTCFRLAQNFTLTRSQFADLTFDVSRGAVLPKEPFTLDPSKYVGLTYGTKKITGELASRILGATLAYSYAGRYGRGWAGVRYFQNAIAGEARLHDTWTGANDTAGVPVKMFSAAQVQIRGAVRLLRKFEFSIQGEQVIPLAIELEPRARSNLEPSGQSQAKSARIIGLLGVTVGLTYVW